MAETARGDASQEAQRDTARRTALGCRRRVAEPTGHRTQTNGRPVDTSQMFLHPTGRHGSATTPRKAAVVYADPGDELQVTTSGRRSVLVRITSDGMLVTLLHVRDFGRGWYVTSVYTTEDGHWRD